MSLLQNLQLNTNLYSFDSVINVPVSVIKNIVLDFGGTVFQHKHIYLGEFIEKEFNLSNRGNRENYLGKEVWAKCAKNNSFLSSEFWTNYALEVGLQESFGKDLEKAFFEKDIVFSEMDKFIKLSKNQGKKIYYLTNTKARIFEGRKTTDIFKLFDGGLTNLEAGVSKPDLEIFKILIKKYNLDVNKTLFLDDKIENIEAAQTLGIKSILIKAGKLVE